MLQNRIRRLCSGATSSAASLRTGHRQLGSRNCCCCGMGLHFLARARMKPQISFSPPQVARSPQHAPQQSWKVSKSLEVLSKLTLQTSTRANSLRKTLRAMCGVHGTACTCLRKSPRMAALWSCPIGGHLGVPCVRRHVVANPPPSGTDRCSATSLLRQMFWSLMATTGSSL